MHEHILLSKAWAIVSMATIKSVWWIYLDDKHTDKDWGDGYFHYFSNNRNYRNLAKFSNIIFCTRLINRSNIITFKATRNGIVISAKISFKNLVESPSGPTDFLTSNFLYTIHTRWWEWREFKVWITIGSFCCSKLEDGWWSSLTTTLRKKSLIESKERVVPSKESFLWSANDIVNTGTMP